MTMTGFGDRLYLLMIGEMNLAITSAPPPVPAGMINSIGFVGSQAFAVPIDTLKKRMGKTRSVRTSLDIQDTFFIQHLLNCLENFSTFQPNILKRYDFVYERKTLSARMPSPF